MRHGPASYSLLSPGEHAALEASRRRSFQNPFRPGPAADAPGEAAVLSVLDQTRGRLAGGAHAGVAARDLYVDASLGALLEAFAPRLEGTPDTPLPDAALFPDFEAAYARRLGLGRLAGVAPSPACFFASCAQIGRARRTIARAFVGSSRPMAALRAAVWDAIFTCDLRDAVQDPAGMMDDLPVLVTGPTGTGKELVAQTLGACRFIAFDGKRWAAGAGLGVPSVNVAALSGALLESELFGHRKGAFTGAAEAHRGWFESCGKGGVLFFDEIGELALPAQPKLLRVLETRKFQRVGETTDVDFQGRLVAATQVDLTAAIAAGTFRMDLYQRLSALTVHTPALRDQLADDPSDLERLVHALAQRARPSRAEHLAERTLAWIEEHLAGYDWPGNVRELLQCVRGVMANGSFHPMKLPKPPPKAPREQEPREAGHLPALLQELLEGNLDEKEAIEVYTNLVQSLTGNVTHTAKRLGVHRNTVAARLNPELQAELGLSRQARLRWPGGRAPGESPHAPAGDGATSRSRRPES